MKFKSWTASSSTRGMTILEVVAVMAILGVLAAIAAPSWVAFANRQRVNRATDQVLQAVRQSQADAKRTRRTRTVKFMTGTDPKLIVGGVESAIGEGSFEPGTVTLSAVDGASQTISEISFASTGGLNDVSLPVHVTVSTPQSSSAKKCVIIRSLLGATQIGSDGECNP